MNRSHVEFIVPSQTAQWDAVRAIFQEYADSLSVDLDFQGFKAELAQLPGEYAAPRGAVLLACVDAQVAGCCALRPLDAADYPNAAEMKRLYVRKPFRRFGLGRQLAEAMLDAARAALSGAMAYLYWDALLQAGQEAKLNSLLVEAVKALSTAKRCSEPP